jgi:hypothetical protein
VAFELPTDPAVAIGVNHGVPAALAGHGAFAAAIGALAGALTGAAPVAPPARGRSLLGRLAGRLR